VSHLQVKSLFLILRYNSLSLYLAGDFGYFGTKQCVAMDRCHAFKTQFRRFGQENQSKHIVDIGADICIKNDMAHFELSLQGDKANG
jgi:hypothetical protein